MFASSPLNTSWPEAGDKEMDPADAGHSVVGGTCYGLVLLGCNGMLGCCVNGAEILGHWGGVIVYH